MWVFVKREHILKSKRNKGGKKLEKINISVLLESFSEPREDSKQRK